MLRNIEIVPCLNGFIVTVGCSTVVFDDQDKMLKELQAYLDDPEKVEKFYLTTSINSQKDYQRNAISNRTQPLAEAG